MNILIANVGNIRVNEIKALAQVLNKKHKITIVSMSSESSMRGNAFSANDVPVRVEPLLYKDIINSSSWVAQKDIKTVSGVSQKKLTEFDGISAYEFDSGYNNPADAISVMLTEIMAHRLPDLVICGINNGVHMGQDIYLSSNIGMAFEAAFLRVPVIAVGVEYKIGGHSESELTNAVTFIEKNVEKFAGLALPKCTFLNINIPTVERYKQLKGVKVSCMGKSVKLSTYSEKTDNRGNKYYWAENVEPVNTGNSEENARTWFDKDFVTIIPINYDATDYAAVEDWNRVTIKKIKENEGGARQ